MYVTNWANLDQNYFDANLSIVNSRKNKADLTSVFQKSIALMEETQGLYQNGEDDFLLAGAKITQAFDKACSKLFFIQKIFMQYFHPSGLFTLYDQLIKKLASKYIEVYYQGSLGDLIKSRTQLKESVSNWRYCGELSISDDNSPEVREIKTRGNRIVRNAEAIFKFLDKTIDVKISAILNKKDVRGIIHQFINKEGGLIYLIGTLGSLDKQYIDNLPVIRERFEQSSKIFVETMHPPFSYNCLDNGFISLAKERNIAIIPFESLGDQISLFISMITAELRNLSFEAPKNVSIKQKELDALRVESWQEGHWDQDEYLKTLPDSYRNFLFGDREDIWLQKTNLINCVSNNKEPISIVVGTAHIEKFLNLFKEMGFSHKQL